MIDEKPTVPYVVRRGPLEEVKNLQSKPSLRTFILWSDEDDDWTYCSADGSEYDLETS